MKQQLLELLPQFREILGLDEDPMGIFYTDEKPAEGFTPKPLDLPTREKEIKDEIDWQTVFGQFSCVLGKPPQMHSFMFIFGMFVTMSYYCTVSVSQHVIP